MFNCALAIRLAIFAATFLWQLCSTNLPSRPRGMLEVRLETPVASYSRTGTPVRATATAPFRTEGGIAIPAGSVIHGRVLRARAVGLGLRRERASLEIEFFEYQLPDGQRWDLEAELHAIDNAREEVKDGRIRGILAAQGPQSYMHSLWYQPHANLFERSAIGLTGAPGYIWASMGMHPIGAVSVAAARMALFRLPEPEIRLPAGTDLRLHVTDIQDHGPRLAEAPRAALTGPLADWLREQSPVVRRANGKPAVDLVNFAFIGPECHVRESFEAAGWQPAEALTPASFTRTYRAMAAMRGYPTAPVSPMHYDGRLPQMVYQKSFNTLSKRHHIRIWHAGTVDGEEVWFGAATHDIGIAFEKGELAFTHRIDPFLDAERDKVTNDLNSRACVVSESRLERDPALWRQSRTAGAQSDGQLAVLRLRDCAAPAAAPALEPQRHCVMAKFARRLTLETRQYLLRGNIYYWGYRAAKTGVLALRRERIPAATGNLSAGN